MTTDCSGWIRTWVERAWQDVRYGGRMFAGNPGFAAIAVLSLAIGIGANTAIFSFADALLLRPLPVARPGDVLTVGSTSSADFFGSTLVSSYRDYVDIRDRARSFDGLTALSSITVGFAADAHAQPRLKLGIRASSNLLSLMGVTPTIGRDFRPDEDQVPGRDAVIILGRTLWEQEFGANPGVLGRTVRINGIDFTVIGVTPAAFTGMDQFVRSDFFVPMMMSSRLIADPKAGSLEARDLRNLRIKGRLRPGVSQASAQAELSAIASDLERAYPQTNKNRRLAVRTELQERIAQDAPDATLVAMLSTLALAVLFVACANVAGLLTSRAPARAREMALRLAIGAGRGRLIRQLVTESLLLAVAGGVAGLGVGYAGMMLFSQIQLPTDLPINLSFRMDRRALVFSFAVAVASALVFGLVPAVQATRTDLTAVMKASDSVAPGRRRRWGRALLVCGQVAVSVVLLVVAMFMYRGFGRQLANGPGYRTDHLLMMSFDPTLVRYSQEQSQQFFAQVADRARAVPGVASVTMSTMVPMSNDSIGFEAVVPEGFQFPVGRENTRVLASRIDEHYFDTMGLTLLEGRGFLETDGPDAPRVAIVNEQFAKHFWPNQDPIGKRLHAGDDKAWVQVVGLAKTSKYVFIAEPPSDFIYFPYRQTRPRQMILIARSMGEASAAGRAAARGRPRTRCESADLQRPHDGGTLSDACDQHLQGPRDDRRRHGRDGAGARDRRAVRPRRLRRQPADARDRHPHGDWRRTRHGPAARAPPGARPGADRSGRRSRRERRRRAIAECGVPERRRATRSDGIRAGHSDRDRGHVRGHLHPGVPGLAHQSDQRAPPGIDV